MHLGFSLAFQVSPNTAVSRRHFVFLRELRVTVGTPFLFTHKHDRHYLVIRSWALRVKLMKKYIGEIEVKLGLRYPLGTFPGGKGELNDRHLSVNITNGLVS